MLQQNTSIFIVFSYKRDMSVHSYQLFDVNVFQKHETDVLHHLIVHKNARQVQHPDTRIFLKEKNSSNYLQMKIYSTPFQI